MNGDIEKLGVVLELTADAHARKVMYHGGYIGMLLFHDWIFKLELGPAIPLRLEVAHAILLKAQEDESIKAQKRADEQRALAEPARARMAEQGKTTVGLSDEQVNYIYYERNRQTS